MRLDLFLKATRLCARRTVAQKLCEARRVTINDNPAKSSHIVKPGDEVSITRGPKLIRVRVLAVPSARQTSRKEAAALYEILNEEVLVEPDILSGV
ncbi:MAG TPA: RNA-binding S4 domain-containing protein [Pyrinomonadaceae bacterium]|nr:RNA-binding S4 domain-containing protein [Pyrinomonadaceae bacterium]